MNVLVLYFSQTGQLKNIVESCLSPLVNSSDMDVDIVQVQTRHRFPFPWTRLEFFNVFPEAVEGIPFEIEDLDIPKGKNYDLIVLAYTVWFLSPSIPVSSLLQNPQAKEIFAGKKVLTLIGSRNMWVLAQEKVKRHLKRLKADLIGNVVLIDHNPNLVSITTIIRWMFYGRKDPVMGLPQAGIMEEDIKQSVKFGELVLSRLTNSDLTDMQESLNFLGAVEVSPALVILEKRAAALFARYARFISSKGDFADSRRLGRVSLLSYLLPIGAFVLSPITLLSSMIIALINRKALLKETAYFRQNGLRD